MEKEFIATGKTIEEAINKVYSMAGVNRDDAPDNVEMEVLDTPTKGFLGFGATEARVKLIIRDTPMIRACDFLTKVLDNIGVAANMKTLHKEDEREFYISLSGENMGIVIGRRGETLDALQFLTGLIANRGSETHIKIIIDAENYRAKREESLTQLAKKVAERVVKYKKSVTLEPMSAYERKIIHTFLQDNQEISTHSVGTDPNRKVVVTYGKIKNTEEAPKPKTKKEKDSD